MSAAAHSEHPSEDESDASWPTPRHAHGPGYLLVAPMIVAFGVCLYENGLAKGMTDWGVSGPALAHGRYITLLTHMFAHTGIIHIAMNVSVLLAVSPPLIARLGTVPAAWARYFGLFLASGLSGALVYLAINPFATVPMLGASGAIYGLIGALLRLGPVGEGLVPICSRRIAEAGKQMIKDNALLFVLLTIPAILAHHGGGLAWEAHLGGLLFGLFVGPCFFPKLAATHI